MQNIWKASLLFLLLGAAMAGMAQEECCPDRAHATSIEGWFLHGRTYIGFSYWSSSTASTGLAIGPGAPLTIWAKASGTLRRTCLFDIHVMGILGLPIGGAMTWQMLNLGLGAEFCFPGLPELAIEIGGGFYLHHYQRCNWYGCWWEWSSGTFTLLTMKFYF